MYFRFLLFIALTSLPVAAFAQAKPADFPQANLTSQLVYSAPVDGKIVHWRGAGEGIAVFTELEGGVEVFVSTTGSARYDGYWVESKNSPTKAFYTPMGDLGRFSAGKNKDKLHVYWAPPPADGWVDHSQDLIWSSDGSAAAVKTLENDDLYIYRNAERYGPYSKIFFPRFTATNELLYLVRSDDGAFRVFRDGEPVSDVLDDVARIISETSADGTGYLYGTSGAASFWMLHNDSIVSEASGPVTEFAISPDGQHYGYYRTNLPGIEPVIDGVRTGEVFELGSGITFASVGGSYVLAGLRTSPAGVQEHFLFADGRLQGPYGGILDPFYFRPGTGELVFSALSLSGSVLSNDQTIVIVGDSELGHYRGASAPYSSPNGAHLAYEVTSPANTELIYLDDTSFPSRGEEITGLSYLTNGGLFHYTVRNGDSFVRMTNDDEIGEFAYVELEQMSKDEQDVVFVAPGGVGEILYRNNAPLISVENAYMTAFTHVAGQERFVSRLFDGSQEYLLIEDQIAGPYDEVMLSYRAISGKTLPNLVFHTRTGSEVTRHEWLN
ncbi:MAG: hypothetical protein GY947_05765 [Rhodobacteraceae bacterium]|nr:hypothetical protein [Paracoccaceae bacterium]